MCPSVHVELLRRDLAETTHVLIAGTSAQDPDLLALLSDSLGDQLMRVDVVTGTDAEESKQVVDRLVSGVPRFSHALRYGDLHTFPIGWVRYVTTELSSFARS